ncbi:MAG: signal peptidase I [Candidatus Babeliales bacterium]|jgi:signal peptidase I
MKDSIIHRIIRWYKRPNKSYIADLVESLIVIIPVVFLIKTFVFGLYQVPTCSMETTMLVGERFLADKVTPFFSAPKRGEIVSFNVPTYPYSSNKLVNLYQQYVSWDVVNYTKRVIAVPGDHIQGKIEDGKPVVYLNGEKLDEPYLNKYPIIYVPIKENEFTYRSYDPSKSLQDQPFYDFTPVEIARGKMYAREHSILYPGTPAGHGRDIDIYDVYLGKTEYWMMGDNRQGSSDCRDWGPWDTKKALFHGRIIFRIWSIDSNESWWIVDLIKHPVNFWKRVRWSRFFQVMH